MYIAGPCHGAPATLANCYLEGYYSEILERLELGAHAQKSSKPAIA